MGDVSSQGNTLSWKTTFLDMNTFLVAKSSNLYPLIPKGYPRKMHLLALESNLCLPFVRVVAKARHPNTLR